MMQKILILFLALFLLSPFVSAADLKKAPVAKPFFLMGDGEITIKNLKNGRALKVRYMDEKGNLLEDAFLKIDHVFGYPTAQRGENVSRRMIAMLDYFSDHFAPGKTIFLKSGYRSPKYNNALRAQGKTAAKTSTHTDGMAIDFYLEGADGYEMWEHIRAMNCCGIGHYGGATIHLDSGRPRFWQQGTAKVRSGHSDHNKKIYLSAEYDRYQAPDQVRLLFTSISDFGFGVSRDVEMIAEGEKEKSIKLKLMDQKEKCFKKQNQQADFISAAGTTRDSNAIGDSEDLN